VSNTAIVSFKMAPDRYAVLKAMAEAQGKSLSEMVRETVEWALDLDRQARLLRDFFARSGRDAEG
jgi:predicted DNA-binding protein